jgi:hypothetical protein
MLADTGATTGTITTRSYVTATLKLIPGWPWYTWLTYINIS